MWAIYGSPGVFSRHLKSLELSDLGFKLLMQISWLHIECAAANLHKIFSCFKAHHAGLTPSKPNTNPFLSWSEVLLTKELKAKKKGKGMNNPEN